VFKKMRGLLTALLALIVLIVVGGGLYLLLADPAPTVKTVETAIPNDRFPN
jgi:tRNA(Met) C34 N-acetyltransferase TmcA